VALFHETDSGQSKSDVVDSGTAQKPNVGKIFETALLPDQYFDIPLHRGFKELCDPPSLTTPVPYLRKDLPLASVTGHSLGGAAL